MIVGPELPSGYSIFCDDVREERHGKLTYVGVYTGELTAYGATPLLLPQLHVVIVFRDDPTTLPKTLNFRVWMVLDEEDGDNETELFDANINIEAPEGDLVFGKPPEEGEIRLAEIRVMARVSPFEVKGPGRIKVRAYDGEKEVRLGQLDIKTASSPRPE